MIGKLKLLAAVGSGVAVSLFAMANEAIAAESVLLTYGPLSIDIPISDLEEFAATGTPSDELSRLLDMAGQNPEAVRRVLISPVEADLIVLDWTLNSPLGEWMLDRVSESIQPATGGAGRLALRSALIGSASGDNEITLLEVMQLYPSSSIVVQGDRLLETYNRINDILEPLEDLADVLRTIEP